MLANLTLKLPPDDPAPVPDHVGGQLEGLELPLPPLPLHLWRRTLLIPPQRRQVGQLIIDFEGCTRNHWFTVSGCALVHGETKSPRNLIPGACFSVHSLA